MRPCLLSLNASRTALVAIVALVCLDHADPARAATLPGFDPAAFVPGAAIDNPYLPINADTRIILRAQGVDVGGEPFDERSELTYGGTGPVIGGVETTILRDRAYEADLLVEETFDFYAQDSAGNVWYIGEDVTNYIYDAGGNLLGTNSASSWRTGVNGGLPGYAMPASPMVGFSYYQEFAAADGALDEGLIFEFLDMFVVSGVTFTDVLRVFETSTLDPALREIKYYAPGFGLIRADEGVDANFGNPTLVATRVATVPLPATLPLLVGGLTLIVAAARRRLR